MPGAFRRPAGDKEKIALRRAKVLDLRIAGHSHSQIAKLAGCCQRTVWNDLQACMRDLLKHQMTSAEQLRMIETTRLDEMLASISEKVRKGDLWAIDRALKISESRRRLLGLDAQAGGGNVNVGGISIIVSELSAPPKLVESQIIDTPILENATDTKQLALEPVAEAIGVPEMSDA